VHEDKKAKLHDRHPDNISLLDDNCEFARSQAA
jgi:hypothetical protein